MAVENNQINDLGCKLISPREAAKHGFFPREYVELNITPDQWSDMDGLELSAILTLRLGSGGVVNFFPRFVTEQGNAVLSIQRVNGDKARLTDYVNYGWNRFTNVLQRIQPSV